MHLDVSNKLYIKKFIRDGKEGIISLASFRWENIWDNKFDTLYFNFRIKFRELFGRKITISMYLKFY